MNPIIKQFLRSTIKRLSFIPPKLLIYFEYLYHLHRIPNLANPRRFTEWIQWYKLNYRNTLMFCCVDKYEVRSFVASRGLGRYLNTLLQVCDDANHIDYSNLPKRFVIKTTDGGNGDNVFVCQDKSKINIETVNQMINSWRDKGVGQTSGEWAYTGCKGSRIIVEDYLADPDSKDGSIDDYKFLCYNGIFRYLWIDKNRYSNHKRGFWNERLEFLKGVKSDHPTFNDAPPLPSNIYEMIKIAEKLASGFPFVRIDLYNIRGKIYFGEMTFYPWSGYVQYSPDAFDYELGKYFEL